MSQKHPKMLYLFRSDIVDVDIFDTRLIKSQSFDDSYVFQISFESGNKSSYSHHVRIPLRGTEDSETLSVIFNDRLSFVVTMAKINESSEDVCEKYGSIVLHHLYDTATFELGTISVPLHRLVAGGSTAVMNLPLAYHDEVIGSINVAFFAQLVEEVIYLFILVH